jgi:hypothetical protein
MAKALSRICFFMIGFFQRLAARHRCRAAFVKRGD